MVNISAEKQSDFPFLKISISLLISLYQLIRKSLPVMETLLVIIIALGKTDFHDASAFKVCTEISVGTNS